MGDAGAPLWAALGVRRDTRFARVALPPIPATIYRYNEQETEIGQSSSPGNYQVILSFFYSTPDGILL